MPYSSSIQLVNDANGAAYAFLADNGSIWQCQWDSQAQIWAKAQQVPQAFGGEKLQALYLDNLWPTPDTPTASGSNPTTTAFIPGIVLAYRVGEGSSAEVFASIGGWGSDGQLSWSVPVQLTDDQLDDHDFALVAAEGSTGGFSLVVQKQEASTPISIVRDQLREANTTTPGISETTLNKRAQETLGADRSDSDLYTTKFNLGFSDSEPGSVVLTAGTPAVAVSAPIVAAPAANPLPLGPQPFTGNTQLSRQQLNAAIAPPPSVGITETQETSQNTRGKFAPRVGGTSGAGQWRAGLLGPATLQRWAITRSLGRDGIQVDGGGPNKRQPQFRWEGAFGIRNIGAGTTSESIAKATWGTGTDNAKDDKKKAEDWIKAAGKDGLTSNTWYVGIGGLLDTKYFYDSSNITGFTQLWKRSPSQTLTEIISHESVGIDGLFRNREIMPGGNSTEITVEEYIGFLLSQNVENQENIPAWLADVGWYAGAVGNAEKLGLVGYKIAPKVVSKGAAVWNQIRKNPTPEEKPEQKKEEEKDLDSRDLFNAIYGSLLSLIAPTSLAIEDEFGKDIDLGFGTGFQNELEVKLRLLYHSIAGLEIVISNSTEIIRTKAQTATESSVNWADYIYLAAGAALPLGAFLPLLSDYIELGSKNNNDTTTSDETETLATNTQQSTPLLYTPPSGNVYIPPSSNTATQPITSQPIAASTSPLQLITLAASENPPITLKNPGISLNPGTYNDVAILGVTIDGTLATAARATVTVNASGSIEADSFQITQAGKYLALPSIPPTTPGEQASYALLLDVFSTNNSDQRIANPPSLASLSANPGNPFANLPLITLEAGEISPLSTADVKSIQLIAVDPANQSSSTIYPVYDSKNKTVLAPSATNNAPYVYSNTGVTLIYTPITENVSTGPNQEIPLLNPGVTATVLISGGVIQKVDLSQPILFPDIDGATSGYSVQLTLPLAVQEFVSPEAARPTFNVTPQSLAVNNLTEEEQFSAQAGQANSGVYLSAGLSDEVPLSGSMGAWPVQNRVTYLTYQSPSETNPSGQEILYLNGFTKAGNNTFEPLRAVTPKELTLTDIYSNSNIIFSAASNPTAATIPSAGPATIVAWIESSEPVVPLSDPGNGSENYQSYMESVYGSQRINFRVKNNDGWAAPEINTLYERDGWIIDHLHAFNAADPFNPGQELTWVAWSETSIDAIKGEVEDFGFAYAKPELGENPIQAVIKIGWINPKIGPGEITWDDLFSDNDGKSTIQEIPWNPEAHVGLGISDISISSLSQIQSNGSLLSTPTISWSQDVRTPYKESVLNDTPYLYLDFSQLQSGGNSINLGSAQSAGNTETIASETGLNFSILGALPKSQATAVQNVDGTGTLSTGLGSNNRIVDQLIRNMPDDDPNPESDPIAIPTTAYTIEFWAQLQPGSNPNGAGLVALGQPSSNAIGPAKKPGGWLMSSSFIVNQITYNEAAGLGQIDNIPSGVSGSDVYGWGWAVIAQGANTSAMDGNGGNNLYSNSLILKNLVSGDEITGVNQFLEAYGVSDSQLIGLNGLTANTIATVPGTQLQFNESSLNAINFDTSSSVLNEGYLIGNPDPNSSLGIMLNTLWEFQLKTGESKVNFSLDPTKEPTPSSTTPPGALTSESYSGYALDFALVSGSAISVNGAGQLVFDFGPNGDYLSSETDSSNNDIRDGKWHYVVASYLPDYESTAINGSTVEAPTNTGTATLYINNKLVDKKATKDAYLPTNINDIAVLLSNNDRGAIDQLAIYDKALSAIDFKPGTGTWPQPSRADALSLMASAGSSLPNQESDLSLIPGAVTSHWLSHTVNPNDAALATYYSIFQPSVANSKSASPGSWSEASTFNPQLESQSTSTSFSRAGSLQDSLVIEIPSANWTQANWGQDKQTNFFFNPANQQLTGIDVKITNINSGQAFSFALTADQVLIGDENIETLQPFATDSNFQYTVLSDKPSFSLLIPKDQLPASSDPLKDKYTATYNLNFTGGPNSTKTTLISSDSVTLNKQAGSISSISNNGYGANTSTILDKLETANKKAIATAAVIEQAPLQLKYVDSGEIFTSARSAALANSPAESSPASSFGQSQVIGNYRTSPTSNTYGGWIAIVQPFSTNAISNPAGRIWIQYTGEYTTTISDGDSSSTPSYSTATAPKTWLNALANSNFSPETPNLPLLGDSNNPNNSGGILIQADPTAGWGQNFGQNILVADINGDKVDELIIGAPQANGGGRVVVISGDFIQSSLNQEGGAIINLANISAIADDVIIITPEEAQSDDQDASIAGFGTALAYDDNTSTLWIGAPNYLQLPSDAGDSNQSDWQPIGAVYTIKPTFTNSTQPVSLQPTAIGIYGSTTVNGPTGSPLPPSYWGSQLGTAIAVNNKNGAIAISAPGVEASLLYSGTEVVRKRAQGQKHVSDPYGNGALIKIQLPSQDNNYSISSAQGTTNSGLIDVVHQGYSAGSTYMQNLRSLQVNNIAPATVFNNQAIQTGAVGAVYFFNNSTDITDQTTTTPVLSAEFAALSTGGGATFYGAQPWNTIGASGFGSSLTFSDPANTNRNDVLAVGASQTGGSGAVYLIDTNLSFAPPLTPNTTLSDWIQDINLGNSSNTESGASDSTNQYLAHLASSFTIYGAANGDQFGNGLVNLGDVNGDTLDDLLIQAYNASSGAGNGYVLFGNENLLDSTNLKPNPGLSSVATGIAGLVNFADSKPITTTILSAIGQGMAGNTGQGTFGSGDVNGDGLNDIPLGSGPNGSAYLIWGQKYLEAINNLQLSKLTSNSGYMLDGLATSTAGSLRSIGDFNGDGYGDFISIEPGTFVNNVRIELGANTQAILADYPYNAYNFTVSTDTQVLPAGDINGDGLADLALFLNQNVSSAADGNQGGGSTTGIVYGRNSEQLPIGSGFGLLAPVDSATNAPLTSLPSQQIAGGLSSASPAVIAVGDTLYAAVQGVGDGDTSIWFTSSSDGGSSWSNWSNLSESNPTFATTAAPSLAFFEQKLYMSFLNPDGELQLASLNPDSPSLSDWSTLPPIASSDDASASFTSDYTPQLINQGDALAILWVDATDGSLYASVSTTPDQVTTGTAYDAPSPWSDLPSGSSAATPALAQLGDTLYMAVQSNTGGSNIYWTSSSDGGGTWASWQALPDSMMSDKPPSLAVFNDTLYLSFIQPAGDIQITSLTDASTNAWAPSNVATYFNFALQASLVTETIGGSEQLALYYVTSETSGSGKDETELSQIYRSATSDPTNDSTWSEPININYNGSTADYQTASGPLAVVSTNGQTVIAYQGGTFSNPSDEIYLATSSTPNIGDSWSAQAYTDPNQRTSVGLSTNNGQLILSYTSSSDPDALQLDRLSGSGGSWTPTATTTVALDDTSAQSVALLQVDTISATGLLFAGLNGSEGDAVAVSFAPNSLTNVSWSAPKQLLESNGTVSFSPIKATAAPAATLLGADPVIAVNNGGTINLYSPGSSGSSLILASSFSASGSDPAINASVAPGLTTTDTGLALTYTNSDTSVSLERLDFFSLDGEAKDGVILTADGLDASKAGLLWQQTILDASNSALSTDVATAPVVVNGNLLLTTVDASTSAVRISAIPNGSDPASTTWLNTTIQLPDGNGGWLISQPDANATSTLVAAGDLDGDGLDDLLLTSDQVAADGSTFTGLRVISGAGSPQALAALNNATATEQAVQLAPALPNSPASVAASLSEPGSLRLTATSAGQRYGLSTSLSDPASWLASSDSLSSAQQLFSSAIASGAAAWSSTSTPPLSGNPALNTASTFGDLNGDGYNDYFDPDGSIWIASAPQAPIFSLWSIRAAGDVNGNGVDDVLLALTPQGPSYPAQSDGKPSAIYSALIDGALFKVTNNTFNLSDLKAALNPYNSTELFDVTTMSTGDEYQSLQNWFSPILKYQAPIEIESAQTLVTGNSVYTQYATLADYNNSPAPTLVHDALGNLYSITTQVIAGGNNTGILLSNTLLLGVGQNTLNPNAINVTPIDLTQASPLTTDGITLPTFPSDSIAPLTPGAAIHDGKLFVAIPSTKSQSGYGSSTNDIWIAYADLNNSKKPLTEATSWTTYQVQSNGGTSDEYSLLTPTLVSEGERLALYFPSGDEGNNDVNLNIHYLYSNDPTQQTGWGSSFSSATNTYTGTSSTISIDASLSKTPSTGGWASSSGVIVTSPIAATTYQGRTVLAFRGYGDGTGDNVENGALLLAFAPTAQGARANIATSSSTTGSPTTDWTLWDTGTTGINTPSIATDQANLYLTYTPWNTDATNAFFFPVALNIDDLSPNKPVDLSTDNLITAGTTNTLPITLQQAGDDNTRINGNNTNIGMTSPYYAGGYFKDTDTQANNIGNAPQSVTPSFFGDALYATNQIGESAAVLIKYDQAVAAFGSSQINQAGYSLAGYSIDGNIDIDGDGFTDILLSDPSAPSLAVDNQYVLFGGDYLDLANWVGTAGNDVAIGTPLADVIYTMGGSDVVESHGGADVIYTGSGNDQISITGPGFVRIDGGSGFDALLLEGLTNQDYDFRLNIDSPEFFAGTKLKAIELIDSANYGSNTLSFDVAAIQAINPDRMLFLTPDANDSIELSNEFDRDPRFDVNFDGLLWNAYAAGATSSPTSDNPALVYVLNPQGAANTKWLENVSTTGLSSNDNSSFTVASMALLAAPDESTNNDIAPFVTTTNSTPTPSTPIPTSAAVHQTLSFGSGLTLTSYRTQPSDGLARFSISSADTSQPRALLYASSSKNSSAEPGRHYTAVAGLAILPKNQPSLDITVPINSEAFSQLRGATLSLQVEEIPYSDRLVPLHLLIEPAATAEADGGLPPVLSGFSLSPDSSGGTASLNFRADTNDGSADALNLSIARRSSADATSTIAVAQPSISDAPPETTSGDAIPLDAISAFALLEPASSDAPIATTSATTNALEGFDLDNRSNDQVALTLQFNLEPQPSQAYVSLLHSNGTTLDLDDLGRAAAAPPPVDPPAPPVNPPVNPPAPPINPVPGTTNIQPTDNDGDGLREVTWAADGYGVDGNRDGVLDAEQAQVAGISLVNDGASSSDYGALAVSGDVVLRDVAIQPTASDGTIPVTLADGSTVSAPLPTGISNTFAGSLSFTVSGLTPGGTTEALIYLPVGYSGDGNAYVRYNYATGRFEEYLDTQGNRLYAVTDTDTDTDGDGFGDAITLTLADGDAQWDGDGLANGSVVDPGFLASGAIEITGDGQNNRLSGNILANQIRGKGKRDVLIGDLGDDILRGGKGDDRLNGGEGADILIGGHGADRFRYSALIDSTVERSDTIQFGRRDQIDLRQLDANTTRKGNQAFRFIADVKFSGQAGELRLFESRLLADVDGDRQADFALNLRSNQAFSSDVLSL